MSQFTPSIHNLQQASQGGSYVSLQGSLSMAGALSSTPSHSANTSHGSPAERRLSIHPSPVSVRINLHFQQIHHKNSFLKCSCTRQKKSSAPQNLSKHITSFKRPKWPQTKWYTLVFFTSQVHIICICFKLLYSEFHAVKKATLLA